ncbi:IDEAL domain-containing protein [Sporolactobacillus sp. THM7-7]|nr:IDEAL domain-containing protein [Sporolactobacillus sp. THM7-7]
MEQLVSNTEKRSFIKWLLARGELYNRETVWLLHYLMTSEKLLGLIHFVDNVTGCRRSITIHEKRKAPADFEYLKTEVRTHNPEKAFHDLRLNQKEPVYIKVNLSSFHFYPEYFSVLEDRPGQSEQVHVAYRRAAEDAAETAERKYRREKLYREINRALDDGDAARFYELTEKLKRLERIQEKT